MTDIAGNLKTIRTQIKAASHSAQRSHNPVSLIAVSKGKSEDDVKAAIAAGQKLFGENRVQEAQVKFEDLRAQYPDLELHLIGPLQTNKAEDAVTLFDTIETLDRPKLAEALAKAIKKTGRAPNFYIEINIGNETQKAGIAPNELENFLHYCRKHCGLTVTGLMCIPPQNQDPTHSFTALKKLADQNNLYNISMGMSADYETAIRQGATHVRIGTAIFGKR